MIKKILFLILFLQSINGICQVDTLHYLPPLFGRTNVDKHYISISTMSTVNVNVDVKKGDGTLIQSVVITQATPSLIQLGAGSPTQGIVNENGLNTVNTDDGIIVTASLPVFVNLRHVQSAQGMCLTSKGKYALGTNFRSGHLYNNTNYYHVKAHMISVMATEDNTVVDFTDISPNVEFKNTTSTGNTSNPINVTLDEGESYVIAAYLDEPGATGNRNDVNGTHITSNKPIVVNSGSWLSGADANYRDIGVDQIVPIDVVGTEYVFVEGDGPAVNERPCVVAEFNNTKIYLNGAATPVTTINAGDYYFILNSAYAANGNMYLRTSEPAYLYQSMCGASGAANGLNFIPPIRCSGLTEVLIPNVNLVGVPSVSITARAGASVYVNGNATPITGALPVPGNPYWVTYDVPGGTGNFLVTSDSVIRVALLTLDGVRGSAGYFSGFSDLDRLIYRDTTNYFVCHYTLSSAIKMNRNGPYSSITANYFDPSLGSVLTIDSTRLDSIYFTYTNYTPTATLDTIEIEVCNVINCSGLLTDTICTISTLVFDKTPKINTGVGDSIVICPDTSSINLIDLIVGNPIIGTWVDSDNSGLLFNGVFQTNLSTPGIYHFSYIVNGQSPCYDSTIVTINVLPLNSARCCPIAPSFIVNHVACNGDSSADIFISDSYATDFSIDGGLTTQSNGSYTGLTAGVYLIRLSFGPNCVFDTTIIITEPTSLIASISTDSITCIGLCDGKIDIIANGGISPYVYQLNSLPSQSAPSFSNLCTGNYLVSIIDTNGCSIVQNSLVESPDTLVISVDSIINESCELANGIISVTAFGGIPNYQYSLNNGAFQVNSVFTGLVGTSYNIRVRDTNNCIQQSTLIIQNELSPVLTIDSLHDVNCTFGNDGFAIVNVSQGTPNFNYSINNGSLQSSNVFNSLVAGNYSICVTDNNGCADTVSFVISQPLPLILNVSQTSTICFGDCNGEINIDVSGSVSPYRSSIGGAVYSNYTFNQFDTIYNVCADLNLIVYVKDSVGCITSRTIDVLEPDSIQISSINVSPSCFNICDGQLDIVTTGGIGNFEYSIDNGLNFQLGNQFTNLCGGRYDVLVRDSNQCTMDDTIILTKPVDFNFNVQTVLNTLCGITSGSVVLNVGNPVNPNYTFTNLNSAISITDPSTASFTGLGSGSYSFEVVDASGCADTIGAGVSDNALTVGFSPAPTHVLCYGQCTGAFTVATVGGTPPYQYSINGGPLVNSPSFTNLCAQTYIILVQDAAGCIETVQLDITEPNDIQFTNRVTDVDCNSFCTGEISYVGVNGGTTPYQFSINGGLNYQADSSFINLCTGQYTLQVIDANNCVSQAVAMIEIDQSTLINNSFTANNITCNNSGDGSILFSTFGGEPPYLYSIDNGVTFNSSSSYINLIPGVYLVEIQDVLNCFAYDTITITEPNPLTVINVKTENICSEVCDGQFVLNATGGTQPYLYSIDNGSSFQSINLFDNLCSEVYQIQITDGNNCQLDVVDSLLFIDTLMINGVASNSNCDVPTGTINFLAAGGTLNYTYSLDNITFNASNLITGLSAGLYDLYVQDANGCIASNQLNLVNHQSPTLDSLLAVQPCHGVCNGSITINGSGGDGVYVFSLDGVIFQASNLFVGVCPGVYNLTVRDGNGCEDNLLYTLVEPDTISITNIISEILCFGDNSGSINVSSQGGIGTLIYSINGSLRTRQSNFGQLNSGNYTITITDELGCSVQTNVVLVDPPILQLSFNNTDPTCFGVCNGQLDVVMIGGVSASGNYDYTWSHFKTNSPIQNNVCAGLYSVFVEDDNGCFIDSVNFEITQPLFAAIDSVRVTGVNCFGASDGSQIIVYSTIGNEFSFDAGAFSTSSQVNNLFAGNHTIDIRDNNNCVGENLDVIIPTPEPLTGFVGPNTSICPGESVYFTVVAIGGTPNYLFNWNNSLNNSDLFIEPIFKDTFYFCTITDINGCSFSTDTMFISTSEPPLITVSNDGVVCPEDIVRIEVATDNMSEEYFYQWSTSILDVDYLIEPTINSDTVFYVTVTDDCNLTADDSVRIDLFLPPIIEFRGDSIIECMLPESLDLTKTFIADISQTNISGKINWTNDIGTISTATNTSLVVTYDFPGIDILRANFVSEHGCEYDIVFDQYIEIKESPIAAFSYLPEQPTNYDEYIQFINESTGHYKSSWTIDRMFYQVENVDFPIDKLVNINKAFNSCLTVENYEQCKSSVCKIIEVEVDQLIYVPNVFTPNDDANSFFFAEGQNIDPLNFHMLIYNRWGEIVFESYDLSIGWDGMFERRLAQMGVYVWKIDVGLISDPDKVNHFVGHVTLLR